MKILVATEKPFASKAVEGIKAEIEGAGNQLILLEKYTEKAQLLDAVGNIDALIVRSDKVTPEVLDAAKELKIVVRAGAGYDNIDTAYAKEKGVDLKLEIKVNNSVSGTYDLNFTVDGSYSGIVDFIRAIQGDNTLVFKIDEFKLVAKQSNAETENVTEDNTQITQETANTETDDSQNTTKNNDVVSLTATFVCKDIKLNIVETVEDNTNSSDTASTTESTTQSSSTATNGSTQTTN